MPRRSKAGMAGFTFHVMNRAIAGGLLFQSSSAYERFLRLVNEAQSRERVEFFAFALMPNHVHFVLRPGTDAALPAFMKWLTGTHAQRARLSDGSRGRGALYQGRYKAIAVQNDRHFLRLCLYVERNPVRKRFVASAADWAWSSAARDAGTFDRPLLAPWPVPRPVNWGELLELPQPTKTLTAIRESLRRGRHYGQPRWRLAVASALQWRGGYAGPGRVWEHQPADPGIALPPEEALTIP
jgi:putative transposase